MEERPTTTSAPDRPTTSQPSTDRPATSSGRPVTTSGTDQHATTTPNAGKPTTRPTTETSPPVEQVPAADRGRTGNPPITESKPPITESKPTASPVSRHDDRHGSEQTTPVQTTPVPGPLDPVAQQPNTRRTEEQQPTPVDEVTPEQPATPLVRAEQPNAEERPRPTTPTERVERARVERPKVEGEIDGKPVREAVISMLNLKDSRGDRVLKTLIEQQFSDDNLKEHFHRALDGGLIVDLGSRRRSAPQIRLDVTSLGTPPSSPTRTTTDFSSSHSREQMKTSLSNTRSLVTTGERSIRIPFKIAALTVRVGDFFNARGSDLTLTTVSKGETKVEQTDVPGTKALHDVQFTITARKPRTPSFLPLKPVKKTDNVSVPVTLLWPESPRSSTSANTVTTKLERPQDVVHADFAGLGDVYHAVENELGGFPPSSEGARRLRNWLHTLSATAPELLSGKPQRSSFKLPGRSGRTEVIVSVTEPKVTHPRAETEGTITRSREASAETSSGESLTRRRGAGVGVQFGTFKKGVVPGGGIGPTVSVFRSTKTESRVTQKVHDEFSATYTGPVTKQDVKFEFVVRVGDGQHKVNPPTAESGRPAIADQHDMSRPENFHGEGATPEEQAKTKAAKPVDPVKVRHYEPDVVLKVEGKATVWSKPHDAATPSTSHDPSTSGTPSTVAEPDPATRLAHESPSMPPGMDASRVLDRVDADHRLPEETISHLAGAVLHRLEVEGLVRAGDLVEVEQRFRRFLEDHAHDLVRGGDGVRFPLEGWHKGAPDVFVRAIPDLSQPKYAGVVESETGGGKRRAERTDSVEVGTTTEVSAGITGSGFTSKKDEYSRSGTVGVTYDGTFKNTKEIKHQVGHEQLTESDRPLHRVRFPAEFEVRFGGRWADPGKPMHADNAHRFHSEIEVVASERPVPLDEPDASHEDPTPEWHDGEPSDSQQERHGYLPPRVELDSLKPIPEMLGTVAKMVDAPREARWLTLVTSPLAGSRPVRFDEHKGLGPLSRQEGELNERNAARDALESFTSTPSRVARFERAARGADFVVVKSHNRPGAVANRERTARVELATDLANPKILTVDAAHKFSAGDVRGTELAQTKSDSHGVKARVDFGNSFPVGTDKVTPTVIANVGGGYLWGKETSHGDTVSSTETVTRSERGYLVGFDATHKVHTTAQHTWHDIVGFGHEWPVPIREETKWVHVPDAATVWVPASEIHRVGHLLDGDLAKLDPADATRYRTQTASDSAAEAANDSAAHSATDTTADSGEPGRRPGKEPVQDVGEESSSRNQEPPQTELPERDDLRPPADVGRGTGRVEVYRPESGKELLTQIAAHLADWTKQPESIRPAGIVDLARQLVGGSSRRQAEFEPINDRLVSDVLGPKLVGADFNAALREMLGNGLPIFLPGHRPIGKIEQLVVLTAELGDGAYHRTVAGEKVEFDLRSTDKSGTKTNSGWVGEGGLGFTAGRARVGQWGWGLSQGGALAHTRKGEIELGQERGDKVKYGTESDGVEFLHDLKVKMEVYSYARSGAYRMLLPGPRKLAEHFEGTFELKGAVRSTVPIDDAVPVTGRDPRPPLAQAEGSLRDWLDPEGRPGGLSDDAVIRPFDAPKLNDAIRELAGGGNGRPMMSPRAIHELQTATTSPMLRAHLNEMLSPSGHEVKFSSGGVKSVKISLDVIKRELVEVLDKPASLDVTQKQTAAVKHSAKTELKGTSSSSTNEPQLKGAAQRPSEMVHDVGLKREWETTNTGESSTAKETKPAEPKKTGDDPSAESTPDSLESRRYLVRLTPAWEITPSHRSSRAPQAWSTPVRTESDRPVLVETNREGLRRLGLDDPDAPALTVERPADSSRPTTTDQAVTTDVPRGEDPVRTPGGHERRPLETIQEEDALHVGDGTAESVRQTPAGLRTVSDGDAHRSSTSQAESSNGGHRDDQSSAGDDASLSPSRNRPPEGENPRDESANSTEPNQTGQPPQRKTSSLADFLSQQQETSQVPETHSRPARAERATNWVKERLRLRTATREDVELHGEGVAGGPRRTFHASDVQVTRVAKDGRDVGLVFYTGRDKTDVRSWLQRHDPSETTQLFPEGVRDGEGINQARAAGEFASVPAPWPKNSLHVFAHGGENRARVALRDGTEVNVDGRTFGRLVNDLKTFHKALNRSQAEALVMVVCDPVALDGPSGTARDFHQALSESFQPPRVFAPTRDVYSRLTDGSGRVEYSVADGGRWQEFPARQPTEDPAVRAPEPAGSQHVPPTGTRGLWSSATRPIKRLLGLDDTGAARTFRRQDVVSQPLVSGDHAVGTSFRDGGDAGALAGLPVTSDRGAVHHVDAESERSGSSQRDDSSSTSDADHPVNSPRETDPSTTTGTPQRDIAHRSPEGDRSLVAAGGQHPQIVLAAAGRVSLPVDGSVFEVVGPNGRAIEVTVSTRGGGLVAGAAQLEGFVRLRWSTDVPSVSEVLSRDGLPRRATLHTLVVGPLPVAVLDHAHGSRASVLVDGATMARIAAESEPFLRSVGSRPVSTIMTQAPSTGTARRRGTPAEDFHSVLANEFGHDQPVAAPLRNIIPTRVDPSVEALRPETDLTVSSPTTRESGDVSPRQEVRPEPQRPVEQRPVSLASLMEATDGQAFREDTTADGNTTHTEPSGRQDADVAQSPERTSDPRPSRTPLRKITQQVRRMFGFDRSKVVQGVTLRGVDPETGRQFTFTSSEVNFRQIRSKDGKTVGLSFSEDLQTEGDGGLGKLTHRETSILLPEGVRTPEQGSHAARDGRARTVPSPWPENSFYISTHGYPNAFGVDLKDGRWLHVSGDDFGHLLNDLRPFRKALDRNQSEALALLVCNVAAIDAPGGAAHDLQHALGQFGRRQPVVAATKPMGTTTDPRSGTWGTYITDGGQWRVLSSGPAHVLGQDPKGTRRAFDPASVEAVPLVRDGRTIGVSFRPDGPTRADVSGWAESGAHAAEGAPWPHRTLFVDADPTGDGRFVVHTPDGPFAVDGGTLGRVAANAQVFRDAMAHDRPEALTLLTAGTEGTPRTPVDPAGDFAATVQREFGTTTPVFAPRDGVDLVPDGDRPVLSADGGWTVHSPAGRMVSGVDESGLRRLVHADDVRATPLHHGGRQVGVSFHDGATHRGLAQWVEENGPQHPDVPRSEDSFVVAADSTPDEVTVHLHDGSDLRLGGDDFADLVTATRPFTDVMADPARAGDVTGLTLFTSGAGAGLAHDFQSALAGVHGHLQPVTAPTESLRHGGGEWRSFPEGPLEPMRGFDPVTATHGWFSPNAVDAIPLEVDGHVVGMSFHPDPRAAQEWVGGSGRDVTQRVPGENVDVEGARHTEDVSTRPSPWTSRTFFVDSAGDNGRFLVTMDGTHRHVEAADFARLVAHSDTFQRALADGHRDSITLLASEAGHGPTAESFQRTLADEFGFDGQVHAPTTELELRTSGDHGESGTVLHDDGDWRTLPEQGGTALRTEGEFFNAPRGGTRPAPRPDDDAGPSGSKRVRDDESDSGSDESSGSDDEQPTKRPRFEDVVLGGPEVSVASLDEAHVVHNTAFDELAPGPVRLPSKGDYLDLIAAGVDERKPLSFVVTAILGHRDLPDLRAVLDGMLDGAGDVEGKVAFVFGVNVKAGGEGALNRALEEAAPIVGSRSEPVALVPLVWDGKKFPYGDMRNRTIDSAAGHWAIGAMVAKGTHPYLAAQDFDAGSRLVPSGEHVFTHVADLLRMGALGERVDPGRPLMISGGYRISDPGLLVQDTNKRIDSAIAKTDQALREGGPAKEMDALRKERAALVKARAKVADPGFAAEFKQLVDEDMRARDRQVGAHPLLPYTPEPNLFIDGLAFTADDNLRFGQGAAEYTNLGKTVNELYADELTRIHGEEFRRPSEDPDHHEVVREQARVDALNNRHPLRGEAFTADFVNGAIETDLSRLAVGWAKDGKLPQSHLDLTTVVNRFFGGETSQLDKAAKRDTSLAEYRKGFPKKSHAEREPQKKSLVEREPQKKSHAEREPQSTISGWTVSDSDVKRLGGREHNTLNRAISAPFSGELAGLTAGVSSERKTIAAHHLATSDITTTMARALGSIKNEVLIKHEVLPDAPPPVPGSLYHAVDPANAEGLRTRVLDVATATQPKTVAAIGTFVQGHPIVHHGHLVNALVQHRTRVTDADSVENTRAGNADDLAARLIATELRNDVVIHHPDGTTTTHGPLTGRAGRQPVHITHHVDADGRHTYEPGGPARTRPAPLDDADTGPSRTVVDDESWRHSTAETADWFAPRPDAVTPEQWTSRRADAHVRTVDTEVADVTTDSTPSNLTSYTGLVRYDVRRIEAESGQWVRDFTVKVHLRPGAGVDPAALSTVRGNAHAGVDALFNRGHRLPGGDQFHVSLEFVDNPRAAHTTIEVGDHPVDQTHWRSDADPALLAHETLHYLGVPDEYRDASRIFLGKDSRSGVVPDVQGVMGTGVLRPDPRMRPRHLWMVERVADSQVAVPDTALHSRPPRPADTRPDSGPGNADRDVRPAPGDDPDAPPAKRGRFGAGDMASAVGGGWGGRRARTGGRPVEDVALPHRDEPPAPPEAQPSERVREDDAEPSQGEPSVSHEDQPGERVWHDDVVFEGPQVSVASLDEAHVVRNTAFDELAPGPVRLPTKQDSLRHLVASVEGNKQVSFVVTAILGHRDLPRLNAVLNGMLRGARDVEGRVAFVFGVNAKAGGEVDLARSLELAAPIVNSRTQPVALVPLVWDGKKFPYGDMRNQTIDSPAGQYAVAALAAKGTHPYLAAQDFDVGSRAVPSGEHVFTHVADLLHMGGPIGDEIHPGRPLMISGGYRISDPGELVRETNKRIDSDETKAKRELAELEEKGAPAKDIEAKVKELATLAKARAKVAEPGFAAEFAQLIDDDMRVRDRQVGSHPLLPYTPEPNLFVDAVAVMADPTVRFGSGAAEYTNLGKTINKLYADELTRIHGEEFRRSSSDPDHHEMVHEQARVDALNNRHPLRGEAFATDFVNGAIGTDLSRLAAGWAKDGKLPQSHRDLTTVVNRFFGGTTSQLDKASKRDTSLAEYRKGFPKKSHAEREPQSTTRGWNVPASDVRQLGGQEHNTLNRAISTPLSGEFGDLTAGVPSEHKTIAAHHLATSDTNTAMSRAIGSLKNEVLPTAPPPAQGSLYRAVDPANADRLRAKVFDVATGAQPRMTAAMTTALGTFAQGHPIEHHGHLVNALIQHRTRVTDADASENTRAGYADDLAARLIATELKNNLVIHHPDGTTTVHEPFAGKAGRKPVHITHHVDADGRHTYEPGGPARTRPAPSHSGSEGSLHMPSSQQVSVGPLGDVRADVPLSGLDTATGRPVDFRTSEVQISPLVSNNRVVGATFWSGGEAVRDENWVSGRRAQAWPVNTFYVSGPSNAQAVGMWLADGRMVSLDGAGLARMLNDVQFFRSAVDANHPPTFGLLMSEASAVDGPGGLAADFQSTLASEFGYRQSAIGPSQVMDRAALDGLAAHDGGPWRELDVRPVVNDIVLAGRDRRGGHVSFRSSQVDVAPMEYRGSVIGAVFVDGPLRAHDLTWGSREQADYALLHRAADDPRGPGDPDAVPTPWSKNSFYIATHGSPQQAAQLHLVDGSTVNVDGATFARLLGDLVFFHHAMQRNQAEALAMIICFAAGVVGPGGLAHDFQATLAWQFGYSQPVHAATHEVGTMLSDEGTSATTVENGGVWHRFPADPPALGGLPSDPFGAGGLSSPNDPFDATGLPDSDDLFDASGLLDLDDLLGPESPRAAENAADLVDADPVNLPELDDLFDQVGALGLDDPVDSAGGRDDFDGLNLPDEDDLFHRSGEQTWHSLSDHADLDGEGLALTGETRSLSLAPSSQHVTVGSLDGTNLARMLNDIQFFRSAVDADHPPTFGMLMSEASSMDGQGGLAADFQSTLASEFGSRTPVFAPTTQVRLSAAGETSVLGGGTWKAFSSAPDAVLGTDVRTGERRFVDAGEVQRLPIVVDGRETGMTFRGGGTTRLSAAPLSSTQDVDGREVGVAFHPGDAPVLDDGLPVLSSTSVMLRTLVLQAIQLEVLALFGGDGHVVASALTGQPGQGDAAEELERALAEWLGSHSREPGWRHGLTPGGVPDEPVVLVVPGVTDHDSVNDSPQADDTPPPARAKSLREFLNGG